MEKTFAQKHSFFIISVLSMIFLVLPGFLETGKFFKEFHSNNPRFAFSIWSSLYLWSIFFIYSKELKAYFSKPDLSSRMFKSVASLKFTVFTLGVSVWLVFVGTLAQMDMGIWDVVNEYFRCFFAKVHISYMIPGEVSDKTAQLYYYFPGGYIIGGAMLINLLSAHSLKFKISAKGKDLVLGLLIIVGGLAVTAWAVYDGIVKEDIPSAYVDSYKRVLYRLLVGMGTSTVLLIGCWFLFKKRAGIVILHFGIILLLFSELITGLFQVEGNLSIQEGKTVSYVDISRSFELALSEPGKPDGVETSIVIPDNYLKKESEWQSVDGVPFEFKVHNWYENSTIKERVKTSEEFTGLGKQYELQEIKEASGVQASSVDIPSMIVEFRTREGENLGKFIFSLLLYLERNDTFNQKITAGGKDYNLMLRNEREYLYSIGSDKPVQMKLIDFRHDTYIGTNVPKNFSSLIQLKDQRKGIDRKVLISMNNPLRYTGRTFYQSSFAPDETGTVLQVVKNPGWMIPYLCCVIVGVGLLFQFLLTLGKFVNKRLS